MAQLLKNATGSRLWSNPNAGLSLCLADRREEAKAQSIPEFPKILGERLYCTCVLFYFVKNKRYTIFSQ